MTEVKKNESKHRHSALVHILPLSLQRKVVLRPGLAKILDNIGWLFFDQILRMGLGLVVGAWVARYLGPSQFGELSYILAIVSIFQVLSQLGISNIAVRELANSRESSKEIIGTVFRLRVVSGLLCFISTIFSMYLLRPDDIKSLFLAATVAGALIFQSSDVADLWFQSELQSKRTVFAKFFSYIGANLIKIILIILHMPLIAFAVVILFESIIFAFALLYSYKKFPPFGHKSWSMSRCKKILREGFPFLASGLILAAYIQFDKILLENMSAAVEVGYYVAATTLTTVFNFLPIIVCSSLAPHLANIQTDEDRSKFFIKLNFFLFWGATFVALLLFLFAERIILLLYGEQYQSSALIVKILAFSVIPVFLSVSNDYLALSHRNSRATLLRTVFGLIINLILNITLIPQYGALGTAISGLVAHWLSNTVLYWFVMKGSFFLQTRALMVPFVLRFDKNKL